MVEEQQTDHQAPSQSLIKIENVDEHFHKTILAAPKIISFNHWDWNQY